MRILMLAQSYAPVVGGEERIVEDLSVELARRGHEVHVATLRQPVGEPRRDADGVTVHLLESALQKIPGLPTDPERSYAPPGPDPLAVRGLRRLLAKIGPEVVHGHNWLADSYLPLDRSGGPAFVLSLHDYSLICATKRLFLDGGICSGPGARKCLRHSLEYYGAAKGPMTALGTAISDRWLRRRVDVFLPVSAAVRDLCGVGTAQHRVIPNFIGSLPPAPAADDPALAKLPSEPFIFYFGDVTEDKGVGVLVEAYAGLAGAPPLVLAGRSILKLPPTPGVVELGRLPHPLAIEALRRALFTVAPTILPESFGIVALEAAAAGKAAIVSDVGGLKDVVRDGETGLLVPPGEVEPLRAALRRLCDDEGLRRRLGEAALLRAGEFSPAAVVPRFETAYADAIALRRSR